MQYIFLLLIFWSLKKSILPTPSPTKMAPLKTFIVVEYIKTITALIMPAQALSAEGEKVENVLCLWPLKCHLLSSSDHSWKLFYYSSGSLTSASSFPVQAVIQVTKINIFFLKQNTLSVSLQGWRTTVNIPDCVKLHLCNSKIQLREGSVYKK